MLRRALLLALITPVVAVLPTVLTVSDATPSAAAAEPRPVLRWELSQFFDDHLATHVLADGATEDAGGVVTFPQGTGTYDRATGAGSIAYRGSVSGSFVFGGSTQYTITVADPVVTVDAAGGGQVTVVLSSVVPPGSTQAQDSTPATRVVATTFTATRWVGGEGDLGTQTATPDFAGVLPAGSAEATELGIPEGQPVDGRSWAASFLRNLVPGVRAIFYASGSGSDATKAPATIVAQGLGTGTATEPEPDAVAGLQWQVSAALDATLETHTLSAGATEDELGVLTFPYVAGTYDSVTGTASVTYSGSVTAKDTRPLLPDPGLPFPLPGSDQTVDVSQVTVADPVVTTDLDGNGTITAVVSSSNPLGPGGVPSSTEPARVEVVRFGAGVDPWVDGTERGRLVRTPPVFSAALLQQLVPPAREHFSTTPDGAPDTLPSVFTAAAPAAPLLTPDLTVTTTSATPSGGLVLKVDGTGFRGVTRTGDTGVRVALGPVTRPDVTTPDGVARFVTVVDVPAASIVDDAFSTTLTVPASRLDAAQRYGVHTWQAPSRSNPTQDTSETVAVDVVALGLAEPLTPRVLVTRVASADRSAISWVVRGAGFSAATRPGDAGVYIGLAESGGLPDVSTFDLSQFVAADWVMPNQLTADTFAKVLVARRADLVPGRRYSFYTWQAHTHSTTSQDTETPVTILRAALLTMTGPRVTTYGAGAVLTVSLPTAATGTVTLSRLGAVQRASVRRGVATFRLPRGLRPGSYRPRFAYSGDDGYTARTVSTPYTVERALPRLRVTRPAAGRLVVRVVGVIGVVRPGGVVVVDGRRVRLVRGRAAVTVPEGDARFVVRYAGSTSYRPTAVTVRRPAR